MYKENMLAGVESGLLDPVVPVNPDALRGVNNMLEVDRFISCSFSGLKAGRVESLLLAPQVFHCSRYPSRLGSPKHSARRFEELFSIDHSQPILAESLTVSPQNPRSAGLGNPFQVTCYLA